MDRELGLSHYRGTLFEAGPVAATNRPGLTGHPTATPEEAGIDVLILRTTPSSGAQADRPQEEYR